MAWQHESPKTNVRWMGLAATTGVPMGARVNPNPLLNEPHHYNEPPKIHQTLRPKTACTQLHWTISQDDVSLHCKLLFGQKNEAMESCLF